MTIILIAADAAQSILARIASGELEVVGILLRRTKDKTFSHILRGAEQLGSEAVSETSPLAPLRGAMSMQQVLGLVAVAQNAAAAASLKRIEAKLEEIEQRLIGIEARLGNIEGTMSLILAANRDAPTSRLRAAKGAAINARRSNDRTALIMAAKDAEQAGRDLLSQAVQLIRVTQNGVPVGLLHPRELADLVHGAAEAMSIASAMHIALGSRDIASDLMHNTADAIEDVRKKLRTFFADSEFMMRRIETKLASDSEIAAVAALLRENQHWTRGRAVLIDAGLYGPSLDPDEFAAIVPLERLNSSGQPQIAFESLDGQDD